MIDKEAGISLGMGVLTGMRGTPLWVNVGISVAMNEVIRANPTLIPEARPKDTNRLVQDITLGVLGWLVGKEVG